MLAASRFGHDQNIGLALQARVTAARGRGSPAISAVSACISPSTSSSGRALAQDRQRARASSAPRRVAAPKSECERSAIFGSMPKRRTCSAHSTAISAISLGVGSRLTWVSARKNGALGGDHQAHRGENRVAPGASPMMSRMWRRRRREASLEAAEHGVGVAALHRERRDHGRVGAHQRARSVGRDAVARRPASR